VSQDQPKVHISHIIIINASVALLFLILQPEKAREIHLTSPHTRITCGHMASQINQLLMCVCCHGLGFSVRFLAKILIPIFILPIAVADTA
jgi:hypothetical protein